jgi:hypothetical protein
MVQRNRVLITALAVVAAVSIAGHVGADEEVFLGYKFADGHSLDYKVKFNQEVDFGGFAFSQLIDMEITEKCVGEEEDKFLMEMVFTKVEAARMQFDKLVEDPMAENLTGHSVTFSVDKFGETSDMKPAGYIDGWQQMQKVVEAVVDNWYAYLPNESVAKGAGWTKEDEPKRELEMVVSGKADYEFTEVEKEQGRECAKIVVKSENTVTGKQDTPAGAMDVDGGGKGTVEFFFCMKSSAIVKYKAKVEMKMDMTPEAGGDATETTIIISMERELTS